MRTELYEYEGLNDEDIRRIERVLGLHEGTINTDIAQPRSSEHRDFYIRVGFYEYGRKLT